MADFELVIFDCDGVLVDSERITNTVFAQMLNEQGLPVTLEDMFSEFVGRSMPQCLEIIEKKLGRAVPERFLDQYDLRTKQALAEKLQPVKGIEDALNAIDLPMCVASSGSHEKMRTTLGLTGLLERFSGKLFSVTEVENAKPHPDVFLYAADKTGGAACRTAVVEDTRLGVRAGIAAGMTVFGYAELSSPQALAEEGAIVFDDMRDLPILLAGGGRG
jgi:HAD superfamily hydrolase (TIGR01509 family)